MASRPSKRIKHGFEMMHTNITPMMNLMVVLIPLLLTSAEFVRLGVIELNLPPASAGNGGAVPDLPREDLKKLDLTVTITDRGFFISSSMAVLSGDREGEPSVPKAGGEYDYAGLTRRLWEIKQKALNQFPDTEQIILMAEPDIDYQTIVSTMDAARSRTMNGEAVSLFPEVALSAGIF